MIGQESNDEVAFVVAFGICLWVGLDGVDVVVAVVLDYACASPYVDFVAVVVLVGCAGVDVSFV